MRRFVNPSVCRDPAWVHWALTVPMLGAHVAGMPGALESAELLSAGMAGYYFLRLCRFRPFPVQVRLAYLGWLLAGTLPGMQWMHWVALAGTTAMVGVGYCPLERMLIMLPFNRSEALTLPEAKRVVFEPPKGGLFYRGPPGCAESAIPSCSLRLG